MAPADRSLVSPPAFPTRVRCWGSTCSTTASSSGDGPALAERNGREAGIDVTPVIGDAARLPVATDSQDVVTACRVLHDLPASAVGPALREAHRVCTAEGTLGMLELPIVPEDTTAPHPEDYWPDRILQAGFTVTRVERVSRGRRSEPYVLVIATP